MLQKTSISCFSAFLVLMAATSTKAAYGPYSQFHRDRRAIRARTMATGEDHITHASIKMRMLNEGRSQVAVNPVRAKRFINAASGVQQPKVSDAFKEYAGNQYGPIFPGKERASVLVDQIQHGYMQPPQAPSAKNAVYEDLLTRQRKDGQERGYDTGHLSRRPENLSQMKDEVDDFLQLIQEMGIFEKPEGDVSGDSEQQRNTGEVAKPSSAASYVNHRIRHPNQIYDTKSKAQQEISSAYTNSQRSSRVDHPRSPTHDVVAVKREPFASHIKETLDDDVVDVEEEATINIPPQALAKSDIDINGLDLEIIKKLLEEIITRKSSK